MSSLFVQLLVVVVKHLVVPLQIICDDLELSPSAIDVD